MNALSSGETFAHSDEGEIAQALTRAAVYRLLGTAFAHPSPSTIAAVSEAAELTAAAAGPAVAAKLRALVAAARASVPDEVAGAYVSALESARRLLPLRGKLRRSSAPGGQGSGAGRHRGFLRTSCSQTPPPGIVRSDSRAESEGTPTCWP